METEYIDCASCGFKCTIPKDLLSNFVFCQRCGLKRNTTITAQAGPSSAGIQSSHDLNMANAHFLKLGHELDVVRHKASTVHIHAEMLMNTLKELQRLHQSHEIRLKNTNVRLNVKSAELLKLHEESSKSIGKFDQLEQLCKKPHPKLLELEAKHSSFQYIWKIQNFMYIQMKATPGIQTAVVSEDFYTKPYGYKMRLQFILNGEPEGIQFKYLSFYLVIMQGEHDAILDWPIKYTAVLSLLDQSKRKDYYSRELESDAIKYENTFDKPTTN
uniref:MATH domain-containing protein n=1 Tax=Strigamia maritima TaxID=126957 RepID=T1IP54_STRMM